MTHICVGKTTIIGSDNGLSPGWRQAIIWTNAGILLTGPLGTNFSGILIEILTFSFTKMRLKVSSTKWRPFCLGLNLLSWPSLVQIMTWRQTGDKPLSEPMMACCQLEPYEQSLMTFQSKYNKIDSRKLIWKSHLREWWSFRLGLKRVINLINPNPDAWLINVVRRSCQLQCDSIEVSASQVTYWVYITVTP